MVGKNNWEVQMKRGANKVKRYTIKRTSVGVVSAVVAAGLIFGQGTSVQADEVTGAESQVTEVSSEEAIETDESVVVEETATPETSQEVSTVEEAFPSEDTQIVEKSTVTFNVSTDQSSAEKSEIGDDEYAEESSNKHVEETTSANEKITEVVTKNNQDVESTEDIVKPESSVTENEVIEEVSMSEGAQEATEEDTKAQSQMYAPTSLTANAVESDIHRTDLLDTSTDNDVYSIRNNYTYYDNIPPKLLDVYTNKKVYQAGEEVKIIANIEEVSEIDYLSFMFVKSSESAAGPEYLTANTRNNRSNIQRNNGNYLVEMVIETDPNMPSNSYVLADVELRDLEGNQIILNSYDIEEGAFDLNFDIDSEDGDEVFPEIISVSTDKAVYQAGEDVKVTAVVKENVGLDRISVEFFRMGDYIQANSLVGSANKNDMTITPLENGDFVAEIVIHTDGSMPNSNFFLEYVLLEDVAGNTKRVLPSEHIVDIQELFFKIVEPNLPYETIYELDLDMYPGSGSFIFQEGVNGSQDDTNGEIIKDPIPEIIHYAPVKIAYETIQIERDDLYVGDNVVSHGEDGLLDPITNEIILAPVDEIIGIGSKIKPEPVEIPFETERILDINLISPYEIVGQEGRVGYRDAETGEVISEPTNKIIYYPPVMDYYEVERIFNPEKTPDSEMSIIQEGVVGLIDPETNQIIVEKVPEIIEYGPVIIDYYTQYRTSPSLEPNSDAELVAQEGEKGLRNPLTWEVIKEPIQEIIVVGPKENEDPTIRNVITLIDKNTNEEVATTEFTGSYYSNRLRYFIRQINSQQGIELEIEEEETSSITRNSIVIDGYRASLITYKKNVYVMDYSQPNLSKPLVPQRVIYNDLDFGMAYREITILDERGDIKYVRDYLSDESTDESIKDALMYSDSYGNYFDRVEVNNFISSVYNNGNYYTGPVREIVIYIKQNENLVAPTEPEVPILEVPETPADPENPVVGEPATPVEPEVPEVEEPETPVEPEVPEVEEPETPVEPEVPEVEEPATPVEPEVPEVEEPETSVEPELPEVEEPETPVEPEVPEVEEPETPVEPEVPEVEEPETPVEPELPEVEEPETPVEPEVPEVEEPETPVEPEVPEVEEPETPVEPELPEVEEPETPVEPELPEVEEPETPVEPEVPEVEEPETPTNPEVPVVEEPETPAEPETPVAEDPETVVESEVPTNDVKAPVATSEDGVVVAEPIPTPAQTVATEGAKAESEVVVAETGSKVAETVLSAEVKPEESSTTVDDQVATLPAAGAQTMSALATGLGMITTALGAVLVRKKK
ncbi:YSIRK-type signal peptide-containing protein [Aerococcus urinaeequi]|uniref:YSIRK-type signal peptide-containing protein n=1 Tax=Aerococcus urinaeequi TaxID=51665 RepID=UPI003D6A1E34